MLLRLVSVSTSYTAVTLMRHQKNRRLSNHMTGTNGKIRRQSVAPERPVALFIDPFFDSVSKLSSD